MLSEQIKIGTKVEISASGQGGSIYACKVESVLGDSELTLIACDAKVIRKSLAPGEIYSMLFLADAEMIRFDCKLLGFIVKSLIETMHVRLISEGERIQRREFFRFNCRMPMKFAMASLEGKDHAQLRQAEIKDIGGGGARIASDCEMEEQEKIKAVITLHQDYIIVAGKILRKEEVSGGNMKFQYRMQFLGLSKEEQEKIVQFIFQEQRKNLQRHELQG
ncbi:MAG: flagellar brake protein [Clostridiales bacterium]|jgi:c-di-GMP-binding flagellar brake protein YcgR|nr:flagellar brake protein [Clostridiales bacterium]